MSTSEPQDKEMLSPQNTRRSQQQALTCLLENPKYDESSSSVSYNASEDGQTRHCQRVQSMRLECPHKSANRVWENPTMATQLVIGCYAAMYKAQGVVTLSAIESHLRHSSWDVDHRTCHASTLTALSDGSYG